MENNCLVTKLKSVVQNDNLPIFGFSIINIGINENWDFSNPIMQIRGTQLDSIIDGGDLASVAKCVSPGVTLTASKTTTGRYMLYVNQNSQSGTIKLLLNNTGLIEMIVLQDYDEKNTFNALDFSNFYGNFGIAFGGNNVNPNTLDVFDSYKNIQFLSLSGNKFVGNLNTLRNDLQSVNISYCYEINGDLNIFRNFANLQTLVIQYCNVTDTDNTAEYLRNKGVNVTYTPLS